MIFHLRDGEFISKEISLRLKSWEQMDKNIVAFSIF